MYNKYGTENVKLNLHWKYIGSSGLNWFFYGLSIRKNSKETLFVKKSNACIRSKLRFHQSIKQTTNWSQMWQYPISLWLKEENLYN